MGKFPKYPLFAGCFKESLRLRPGVIDIAQRLVLKFFKLVDIFIKKGTMLQSGYYMSCHDERFYDNADKFIPERWLNKGKNHKTEEEEPYLFASFSAGNRNHIYIEILNYIKEIKKSKYRIESYIYHHQEHDLRKQLKKQLPKNNTSVHQIDWNFDIQNHQNIPIYIAQLQFIMKLARN